MTIKSKLKNGIVVTIKGLIVKKNEKQLWMFTKVNPEGIFFSKQLLERKMGK